MLTNNEISSIWIIYMFAVVGLAHGAYNIASVLLIDPVVLEKKKKENRDTSLVVNDSGDQAKLNQSGGFEEEKTIELNEKQLNKLKEANRSISNGANTFLAREFIYLAIFIIIFALIIFFFCEEKQWTAYTTIAFLIGAGTSILSGWIGMKIATAANYRTTYSAYNGLGEAFRVAYHGGCVMGFMLVSISLSVLMSLILIYRAIYLNDKSTLADQRTLFESIAGYGLGGSFVALFCRVGGGIYTKAADVGADLVGKLDFGIEEDDPSNPATIADNVGDNVGDIAGMGSDLFGSLAESLTAALLVGATSPELINQGCFYYPLLIVAFGIGISVITSFFAFIFAGRIETYWGLEWTIKLQIIISSVLLIPAIVLISIYFLPKTYSIGDLNTVSYKSGVTNYITMVCPLSGLISGMLIGLSTEYYTSMSFSPVNNLVDACKQGAAINIILGLSLGFLSTLIPTILIAGTVLGSYTIAGMYGIALAAIGMLSNLPICLAIDGYGPISDNAGGLSSMCELPDEIRSITDDLDSAGNTTAAVGKGFAIGSACLVALALFGAFVTKTKLSEINALLPIVLTGLIIGAMMPYLFSALAMMAVGRAAEVMVEACREDMEPRKPILHEIREKKKEKGELEARKAAREDIEAVERRIEELETENAKTPVNSDKCIGISTDHSLAQMFLPGAIIVFVPIILGILFSPKCVAGYLIGVIISGIQMAISAANSGGAWDNAKKLIKTKGLPMNAKEIEVVKRNNLNTQKANLVKLLQKELENNPNDSEEISEQIKVIEARILIIKLRIQELEDHPDHLDNLKGKILVNSSHEDYHNIRKYKKSAEKASIVGDTVGDPMKDTSGPSLNILIKLSSILSVVFGTLFLKTSWLIK